MICNRVTLTYKLTSVLRCQSLLEALIKNLIICTFSILMVVTNVIIFFLKVTAGIVSLKQYGESILMISILMWKLWMFWRDVLTNKDNYTLLDL